ncbi:MAG TPA: alpha/beta hydrolase [Acidimicrobiales bacterium]|jgi:pimeloyl-ACP methyl ester carboxylesterase|nr:alpha/beta hydrolase [Acidimicrobiales bacterium]
MNVSELETHRRTIHTAMGPVSCLDVGEGPVTLFVHGVGTNALLWRRAIGALAGERRCVAVDLPLHGHTPAAPDQDFRLGSLAAVLDAFCTSADLGVLDLVAHDTGGAVAQVFAANHPGWLRSLCLTNCDTHDNIPPEEFKPTVELAAAGAIAAGAADLLADLPLAREALFGTGYQDINHLPIEVLRSFLRPVLGTPDRAHQFEQLLVSLLPEDLLAVEPDLAELQVPTLIVWGTADPFFELSWAYWLKDLIPGATEVIEIKGGRLFFPDERSDELVNSLRGHWSTLAPAA